MAPGRFIPTDQTGLLRWEVIVNGQDVVMASLQPAVQNREKGQQTWSGQAVGSTVTANPELQGGINQALSRERVSNN